MFDSKYDDREQFNGKEVSADDKTLLFDPFSHLQDVQPVTVIIGSLMILAIIAVIIVVILERKSKKK